MKRWVAGLVVLTLAAAATWMGGRAPTAFVLEEECQRYHAERVIGLATLQRELTRARHLPASTEYRRRIDAFLREHKRLDIRGWEILLIPAGATRPDPADFLRAGQFLPTGKRYIGELAGPIDVWIAARGTLARFLSGVRVSP